MVKIFLFFSAIVCLGTFLFFEKGDEKDYKIKEIEKKIVEESKKSPPTDKKHPIKTLKKLKLAPAPIENHLFKEIALLSSPWLKGNRELFSALSEEDILETNSAKLIFAKRVVAIKNEEAISLKKEDYSVLEKQKNYQIIGLRPGVEIPKNSYKVFFNGVNDNFNVFEGRLFISVQNVEAFKDLYPQSKVIPGGVILTTDVDNMTDLKNLFIRLEESEDVQNAEILFN